MTIQYQLFKGNDGNVCSILKTGDGKYTSIPIAKDNSDYQEYLEWLKEGNTPLPPDPEPEPLTPQQKLEAAGLTVEDLRELLGL